MFQVTSKVINVEDAIRSLENPEAGSLVSFSGNVRNINEKKQVSKLEYEVYEELAIKEGLRIMEEAKSQFDIIDAFAVHRKGVLNIGEVAVWIGVTSRHRQAGFKACQYLIDEIKIRLPIWKKEFYLDEKPFWINCMGCLHHKSLPIDKSIYEKKAGIANANIKHSDRRFWFDMTSPSFQTHVLKMISMGYTKFGFLGNSKIKDSDLVNQFIFTYEDLGKYKSYVSRKFYLLRNPFLEIEVLSPESELPTSQIDMGILVEEKSNLDVKLPFNTCISPFDLEQNILS